MSFRGVFCPEIPKTVGTNGGVGDFSLFARNDMVGEQLQLTDILPSCTIFVQLLSATYSAIQAGLSRLGKLRKHLKQDWSSLRIEVVLSTK